MNRRTVCPICLTSYSGDFRRVGSRCGDLSQRQRNNCVGRVMPVDDFLRAEWRSEVSTDPEVQRALDARAYGCWVER